MCNLLIGTTHRHGYGADNVLEYKVVLADGSIGVVNNENTTIIHPYREVLENGKVPNLRYGLRGAGPSFGIVTEFLYKGCD